MVRSGEEEEEEEEDTPEDRRGQDSRGDCEKLELISPSPFPPLLSSALVPFHFWAEDILCLVDFCTIY